MDKFRLNEIDKYSNLEKGFTWQPTGLNHNEVNISIFIINSINKILIF
jgi:hypothetical protein